MGDDISDLVDADSALEQPSWTRAHDSTLPASGAWRPSDPAADRQFLRTFVDRTFVLEGGGQMRDITVAFETWGTLAPDASNAILPCHALTGDAHAAGPAGPGQASPGWWDGLIGPGRVIDTDRWFVVCANVLGGCQGTTGPASHRSDRLGVYGPTFPVVTVRDMVRTQARLADALGIHAWAAVVGGSMGGMQVLEWGVMFPDRVRALVPIATCTEATAQQIAYWSTGRRAIALDPAWNSGDYYDAPPGQGPHAGLALARMISQITFRTDRVFTDKFGRDEVEPLSGRFGLWHRFQVERYLEHHGDKLIRRFDANSYLLLTKAMDLHDLSRGRGGLGPALARIKAPVLAVGVSSDTLYPAYQSQEMVRALRAHGQAARYAEIVSPHGHDAFLLELGQVGELLGPLLADLETL
ncbi:MAG: homoserine O-acetyltransferase MetX [Iamia sp.]